LIGRQAVAISQSTFSATVPF